jgi:hypothetical protein
LPQFDLVSCTQEISGTPLLDLQSDPSFTGYFEGLQQVVIRDYMNADARHPRFGAGTPVVAAINCSALGCMFDGLTISSAGLDTSPAVRVYAGGVQGTTLLTASREIYSAQGVLDRHNLPVGTWKETAGAGWTLSGPATTPAITFLVSGDSTPRKVLHVDGSEEYRRCGAPEDEDPSVLSGHLANTTSWNPPQLSRGDVATLSMPLRGVEPGDALSCGHSAVRAELHTVQLTASAGDGIVKAVLQNLGDTVDIPSGQLRVVVVKMKTDDTTQFVLLDRPQRMDDHDGTARHRLPGKLKWFSFYGANTSEQHTFATIFQTKNTDELAAAWKQYKIPGMVDVEDLHKGAHCPSRGCFKDGLYHRMWSNKSHLNLEWQKILGTALTASKAALDSGAIRGFFL